MYERKITLVVNMKTKQVACPLLQVIFGGESGAVSGRFNPRHWFINPPDDYSDLGLVTGTVEQWNQFEQDWDKAAQARKELSDGLRESGPGGAVSDSAGAGVPAESRPRPRQAKRAG